VPAASRASERQWSPSQRGRVRDSNDGASHGRLRQRTSRAGLGLCLGGCDWQPNAAPATSRAALFLRQSGASAAAPPASNAGAAGQRVGRMQLTQPHSGSLAFTVSVRRADWSGSTRDHLTTPHVTRHERHWSRTGPASLPGPAAESGADSTYMLEALVRLPPPGEARFAGLATLLLASGCRRP
jgi:hypothetical protein